MVRLGKADSKLFLEVRQLVFQFVVGACASFNLFVQLQDLFLNGWEVFVAQKLLFQVNFGQQVPGKGFVQEQRFLKRKTVLIDLLQICFDVVLLLDEGLFFVKNLLQSYHLRQQRFF